MSSTLLEIIDNIRPRRMRGTSIRRSTKAKRCTEGQENDLAQYRSQHGKWTAEDQDRLFQLMLVYGTDYSLFMGYFPQCTRKQLKRQLAILEMQRGHDLTTSIDRRNQLRKQSVFEEEVLEVSLDPTTIEQLNKPMLGLPEPN